MTNTVEFKRQVDLVNLLERQLKEAQGTLKKLQLPPEPRHDFITFTLQFERYGKSYRYAAVRADNRWFTTGSTCPKKGYSWAELVALREEAFYATSVAELSYV